MDSDFDTRCNTLIVQAENLRNLSPVEKLEHLRLCGEAGVALPTWFVVHVHYLRRLISSGADLDELDADWRERRGVTAS